MCGSGEDPRSPTMDVESLDDVAPRDPEDLPHDDFDPRGSSTQPSMSSIMGFEPPPGFGAREPVAEATGHSFSVATIASRRVRRFAEYVTTEGEFTEKLTAFATEYKHIFAQREDGSEEYPHEATPAAETFSVLVDEAITAFVESDPEEGGCAGFIEELEAETGAGAAFMQSFIGAVEFEGVARLLRNACVIDFPMSQWLVYAWLEVARGEGSIQAQTQSCDVGQYDGGCSLDGPKWPSALPERPAPQMPQMY